MRGGLVELGQRRTGLFLGLGCDLWGGGMGGGRACSPSDWGGGGASWGSLGCRRGFGLLGRSRRPGLDRRLRAPRWDKGQVGVAEQVLEGKVLVNDKVAFSGHQDLLDLDRGPNPHLHCEGGAQALPPIKEHLF